MFRSISLAILFLVSTELVAQPAFTFHLQPVEIENLGGVQSFAFGVIEDTWVIMGGRLDGLHRRQPWASFDAAGNNNQIMVVNPATSQIWTRPLSELPSSIAEQLSSTNMEFYQDGNHLVLIGGYGYSATSGDHITYPNLMVIEVEQLINAVQNNEPIEPFFHQIEEASFAVTGGYLHKIESVYYLVGGQRFDGRYNPMNGPSFTQEYTNAIRRFQLDFSSETVAVAFLDEWYDEANLHRRDYNVSNQIMPDGSEGLTAFSGVFNQDDLPFLQPVDIIPSGHSLVSDFDQFFNHYHCAHIPLYRSSTNEMHTVFFGGMAQYYMEDGMLIQDDNVPFVESIACITRFGDGSMEEYLMDETMPGLLGSGAEFIPLSGLPSFPNSVIDLDAINGDSLLIGYIFGGIESTDRNIFWINDGTQSVATTNLFEVYVVFNPSLSDQLRTADGLNFQLYPNPSEGLIHLQFDSALNSNVEISLIAINGTELQSWVYEQERLGDGVKDLVIRPDLASGTYLIRLNHNGKSRTKKLIIK